MAKGTKFTATWEGKTFTRTSKTMDYRYCVVVEHVFPDALDRAAALARSDWRKNVDYYRQIVAGTARPFAYVRSYNPTPEVAAKEREGAINRAKEWLDGGEAGLRAKYEADVRAGWAGRMTSKIVVGWSQTLANAEKMRARYRSRLGNHYLGARYAIVDAVKEG